MQDLSNMFHSESCKPASDRPCKLQQHMLVNEKVKSFICPDVSCEKAYTSKTHLDRHIKSVHTPSAENIIYSCPKCLKKFANKQNIKRHLKTKHAETRARFSCAECSAEFKKKHRLSSHMFSHTGVMAFSCDKCSQSFVTLQQKKSHMKSHKTYVCGDCRLVLNRWSDFLKHKRVEHSQKEYICDHCQRKFKCRQHILHHMKIHSRPKTTVEYFVCPHENCTRKYTKKSNLKQHILVKHVKVTHNCTICDAKLSTKAKLSSHVKNIHERGCPIIRKPKTKATGRRDRKDKGVPKSSVIFKIAGMLPRETQVTQVVELEASC